MVKYSIMMLIRVICLVVVLFIPGWWKLIPAAGAIFLPYFAVIVANVGTSTSQSEVLRPGAIVPVRIPDTRPAPPSDTDWSRNGAAAGEKGDPTASHHDP